MARPVPNADAMRRSRMALFTLNFFMADMQAGTGPFLGVYLQSHHWTTDSIGTVITLGGIAAMAVTTPAGAFIDRTHYKRAAIVISGVCTVLASALILFSLSFGAVALSQAATAIAGAVIGPAVVGLTLGVVRQQGFIRQNGQNQAFNHAGNMTGAALSGFLGWKFGLVAVFLLAGLFAVLSIISVLAVSASTIDHRAARGLGSSPSGGSAKGFAVLLECKPLLILAFALMLFHLGNAAMLPFYGLAVVATHQANPALFVATTVVVAQGVMVAASLVALRMAETRGYWIVMLISFLALPVRGLLAASLLRPWGVFPIQALDGIGAGLQSVAVPGLVARIMNGTGRVNVAQGAVMTMQGIGAALSPALGGLIAQNAGYPTAFIILGIIAVPSVLLWLGFSRSVKTAATVLNPKAV
ncbi:MAG TPA: MFS transporter [Rhizomicrobium sp.]|jgi:MFS family permease